MAEIKSRLRKNLQRMHINWLNSNFKRWAVRGLMLTGRSAMSTSPSELLSSQGNKGIIHLLKGNEDALRVMNQEWQQYKQQHGPGSYDKFVTNFNQTYDPRVFQAKYMDKKEKQEMVKGMSDQEKQEFFR